MKFDVLYVKEEGNLSASEVAEIVGGKADEYIYIYIYTML